MLRGLCKGLAKRKIKAENLARSLRRSRAQVRRKCMAGGLDHLLTLTYAENMTDLNAGWRDFKQFLRYVRKRRGGFAYLAVPEFQKRGAVHFHVAVHGFQDVRFLRRAWVAVVGAGNIDVKGPRVRGPSMWARTKLAGYLTKYITKNASTEEARQRYRVAEGIEIPGETRVHRFPMFFDFVAEIFDSLGVPCAFHWKAHNAPHGWACSW
ncbi:MAG: rolling circle replication-associated protein [Lysobacterales bacterium]